MNQFGRFFGFCEQVLLPAVLVLIGCFLLAVACTCCAHGAEQAKPDQAITATETETGLLAAINAERAKYSLPALAMDTRLLAQARRHCERMARLSSMFHSSDAGAENVAYGYQDTAAVVSGWMHSKGHRANILGGYRSAGVAVAQSSGGRLFWCLQLSTQAVTSNIKPVDLCAYDPLREAQAQADDANKPLIVAVGATWCGPCQIMQARYETVIRSRGVYLHIDTDRDTAIYRRLPMAAGPIPRVIVWERLPRGGFAQPKVFVGLPAISVWVGGR